MTLLQNLANGVRAAFPATPAPTNTTLAASQKMPDTGSPNANAQNTVNTLFGKTQTSTPATSTAPVQQPPAGFNPITTGGDISKAQSTGQYSGGSIVDYLNSKGMASDYGSRSKLAAQYGISGYGGTAEQNTALLNALRNGAPQSSQAASNTQNTQSSTPTNTQASQSNSGANTGSSKTTPAVTYTPPQTQAPQVPQNQPQGNVGQTGQTMQPQDMTYGGLIQESLRKQNETADQIRKYQEALANETNAIANEPISLEFKTGHTRNAQMLEAAKEQALQAQLGNQANIYGKAISALAPTTQFGQLVDPRTGLPIGGNSVFSNPVMNTAVAQAVQLVQNGADPNSSAVQNLLGAFGMPGQAAFTNAMQQVSQGTYNPTAQSAISQANIQTGIDATQTAAQLNVAMDRYHNIANQAIGFLTSAGINNYLSPAFNEPINKFLQGNLSPADKITADAMFADLKNAGATILGTSTNLTPTEVSEMTASFDPRNLSPKDLQVYIDNISKLGQTNKAAFEKQGTGALSSGTLPYVGTQAVGGQALQTGSTVDVPTAAAASTLGLGMKMITGFANMFSNIFK